MKLNFLPHYSVTCESNCSCIKYFALLSSDLQSFFSFFFFFFLAHDLVIHVILQLSRSLGWCVKCEKLKLVNTEKQHMWTLNAHFKYILCIDFGPCSTVELLQMHPLSRTFKICSALSLTPQERCSVFLQSVGNLCMFPLYHELFFQLKVCIKSGHGILHVPKFNS